MELSNRLVKLNISKRSKCILAAIAKNTAIATQIMVVFIHFTSLAKFTHETPKQTLLSGAPGIIHCSALGNPSPYFKWSKQDGRGLQDGRFIELASGSLMIKSIQAEDSGTYICAIKQPRGSKPSNKKSQSINVMVVGKMRKKYLNLDVLRTFALIVTAHPYCARKFECHVMHRARALSTKMNNDSAGGHCYDFAWILRSWTFGDPYFTFQKHILFTLFIPLFSKNKQKVIVGS